MAEKKKASKKKAAPKKSTKASLASELNAMGIPVPEDASLEAMQHRKKHWIPGPGWVVRMYRQHPKLKQAGIMPSKLYWLPNSKWAEELILTKKLTVVRRMSEVPGKAIMLDVPEGWNGSL